MTPKIIVISLVILDQLTKYLVRSSFSLFESKELTSFVSLTYVQNTGSAFGIFHNLAHANIVFIVLAVIIITGLILYQNKIIEQAGPFSRYSLALILAGAFGNLIDRVFIGSVTDFVDFHFFPVFNVADSCISIGSTILFVLLLRKK